MADVTPLKLANLGAGAGELREFASGDTLPSSMLAANLAAFAGLAGVADRLPYFTGAGALSLTTLTAFARALLDDADALTARATLELVKQTSATDTTAGVVLLQGAHGLGAIAALTAITQAELDNYAFGANGGTYRVVSPAGLPAGTYTLRLTRPAGSLFVRQELLTVNISTKTYSRIMSDVSGITPWVEMYSRANILGTVSQSAGVPTGAIIERGSNANGEYVRYADGTQICNQEFSGALTTSTYIDSWVQATVGTWTYPAPFITASKLAVAGSGLDSGAIGIFIATSVTASNLSVRYLTRTVNPSASTIKVMAIGRWF